MHHPFLSSSSTTTTTTMPPSSSSYCKHSSPSATTLDLLILILVLFSGSFLLTSYCSYILTSLSLLLPSLSYSTFSSYLRTNFNPTHLYYIVFSVSFVGILTFCEVCCVPRSRKCGKVKCKGLKKCMEFDLQIVKEGVLRANGSFGGVKKSEWSVEEIEELPWKGGSEGNPDYECLRVELRKIAPANGKAVLLFRAKCGCPIAKLEGWGLKRGRRLKK